MLDFRTTPAELCDDLVAELLQRHGLIPEQVDAFEVARCLGIEVAFDARQPGRGRIKRMDGRPTVLLKPEMRPERMQWALAHEIGESLIPEVARRLDWDFDEAPRLREVWANEFASRLLLPRDAFLTQAVQVGGDVMLLKSRFPRASYELLLWGLLRLPTPSVMTVFDAARRPRRRSNTGHIPPLTRWEREVQQRLRSAGLTCDEVRDECRLQGWAIHEPGWKRELLRVTYAD